MRPYPLEKNRLALTTLAGWLGWPGLARGWERVAGLGLAELGELGLAGLGWAGLSGWLVVWLVVWLAGGRNPSICRYMNEGLDIMQK